MCGIAGILQTSPLDGAACDDLLASLQRALRHRGPDDQGRFVSSDGAAAFVHTRLSILDLTQAGHQPMHSPDGRYSITFNGEIYNFLELRRTLEQCGEVFRTRTDTEVMLRLYARFGPDCVSRLRGMFAFAIWDAIGKSCYLARDLFGIKPLYYHQAGGRLLFASEVRALLGTGLVPRCLNAEAVAGYFQNGSVQEPDTLVQNVRCLEAGHALLWKDGQVREWQHSALTFTGDSTADSATTVKQVRGALEDSIEHHFISDVPVGIFLSGGIDSTALLALASRGKARQTRTFCIRFAERAFDEGELARRTAAHFGATHAEWTVDAATGRDLFNDFAAQVDQPTIDGLNTFVVSKFAREHGMKVVLSGLGGDELFGGYPSFARVPAMVRAGRRLGHLPGVGRLAGAALERFSPKEPWRRFGHFLRGEANVAAAYLANRAIYLPDEARQLAFGYTGRLPEPSLERSRPSQPTLEDDVSVLELSRYMCNQLLRDSDVMSMAWGLELRVPFLDQPLFSTLAGIPSSRRLQPGKRLLLQAVPEVPADIALQPKRGFVFPFKDWFGSEWDDVSSAGTPASGIRSRTWYQQWAVFTFERWCHEHGVLLPHRPGVESHS